MSVMGVDLVMLLLQLTLIGWPLLSLATLVALRRCHLTTVTQAFWILIILLAPILGACAFWIIQPTEDNLT
jgi:hypothetical protein